MCIKTVICLTTPASLCWPSSCTVPQLGRERRDRHTACLPAMQTTSGRGLVPPRLSKVLRMSLLEVGCWNPWILQWYCIDLSRQATLRHQLLLLGTQKKNNKTTPCNFWFSSVPFLQPCTLLERYFMLDFIKDSSLQKFTATEAPWLMLLQHRNLRCSIQFNFTRPAFHLGQTFQKK